MKILITGLALGVLCVPVFAQNATEESVNASVMSDIERIRELAGPQDAQSKAKYRDRDDDSKRGHYGNHSPSRNTTIIVTPGYGYPGYGYPAYPGYPAYGYPAPYPYPYPYPSNTIVGAPIAPPHYSWDRPAYATSIPLGTTYYNNAYPNYYNGYPSYGYGSYGYGTRQSTGANLSIGKGSVRLNVGGSKTTVR